MECINLRRRKLIAVLAVAYHLPTTRNHMSSHSFQLQPPDMIILPNRIQHGELSKRATRKNNRMILWSVPPIFNDNDEDGNNEEQQRRELVRATGSRRRIRTLQQEEGADYVDDTKQDRASSTNDDDSMWSQRNGGDRRASTNSSRESFTTTTKDDWDDDDDEYDDNDVDDFLDIDQSKRYDLLENIIIPNPLLDSMDPDGTIDRLPELFRDPRFWFDMVLFVLFLDFLSFAGPQSDPFADFPWIY